MSLAPGTRVGPYEIVAPLGAGGMGEVYRARDAKLGRDVAIKMLPTRLADDADRLARFAREARVLASLNHPHIAAIYGFEDAESVPALVLELVEGETLAARARRGPMPPNEARRIASAIAEALEAAHDKGIVHRDLKPANVMLSRDDAVKVLDFGVAKAASDIASDEEAAALTVAGTGTRAGIVLGTAAYMSPEQARGHAVDKRTDIWAFGCVLYEMLAGCPVFTRETVTDTVAAVLERDPDWSALPPTIPRRVQRLLQRCLEKNVRERWRDAGDLRIALDDAFAPADATDAATPHPIVSFLRRRRRQRLAWIGAIAAVGVFVLIAAPWRALTPSPQVIKFSVYPPPGTTFPFAGGAPWPSISPDGRQLAFIAVAANGEQQLWLQGLDSTTARSMRGTEGAMRPFWSPDSRSLAYFADGKMWRLDLPEGAPQVLTATPYSGGLKGAWGRDVIAFEAMGSLHRVAPSGGAPELLAPGDPPGEGQRSLESLSFLPDGRRYLMSKFENGKRQACVASVDASGETCVLDVASPVRYATPGYLLFVRDALLRAQPFDADRLTLSGDALPVSEVPIRSQPVYLAPPFSASNTGVVAYHPSLGQTQLLWVDRTGKRLEVVGTLEPHNNVHATRDGRKVIFSRADASTGMADSWVQDMTRGAAARVTYDGVTSNSMLSPDGTHVAYVSERPGAAGIYRKAVSGLGKEELILRIVAGRNVILNDWSSSGEYLLFQNAVPQTGWDLFAVRVTGDHDEIPLVTSVHGQREGHFSPDVQWMAYDSTESGRREIWVQPFPPNGSKWQVSTTGGFSPRWRGDGRELFYVAADGKLMSVPVTLAAGFEFGKPVPLFQTMFREAAYSSYDVTQDGQRFLVSVPPEGRDVDPITVVVNWTATLRK